MLPKNIQSLWTGTTPQTDYPSLSPGLEVDVAIIGGGLAGLNAAYFLAREGKKVAVIETSRIGSGTSGNTTAKVTSQHDLKYVFLKKHFGFENAQLYAQSNQWAIDELGKIIAEEKINCDFTRLPAYVYAWTDQGLAELQKEEGVCQALGLPASVVEKVPSVPFAIKGALKFENQAYFHPRKFLLALAEKIKNRSGYIFENTKALDIRAGEQMTVVTDQGEIRAAKVIVATNYPFFDKGFFFFRTSQARSYGLAAEPQNIWPEGMFINGDKEEKTLSFRPHQSGEKKWLIIGGESHAVGEKESTDHFGNLAKIAAENFGVENVEYIWSAQDSMPIDRVPFIGRMPRTKNVFVTTGYGKWGITTSFVSARILADLIAGRKNKWSSLYDPKRFKLTASLREIKNMIRRTMKSYLRYFKKEQEFNPADLSAGEGKVVSWQGQKVAVFKEMDGKIRARSAVCTHLGCVVGWNQTEKTWDCPCHGSRFAKDGKVLRGPAAKELTEISLE